MRIEQLLLQASTCLKDAGSATPRLDAELLLGHVLGRERTWLYTWSDREVAPADRRRFDALLAARVAGEPIAYLTGEREFWGLRLRTHASTLIPRPETECLVEAALARAAATRGRALDLGTGSGAIALAFASERPGWHVSGVDRIADALALARGNAARLGIANVEFLVSDWFSALSGRRFDLILANPPYIADDDPHLDQGDVRFEPRSALVAGADGLADLRHLVVAARDHLVPGGWLLLEHGWTQGPAVSEALLRAGYEEVATLTDLAGQPRVAIGRLPA
ncbi:[protein release factor]-glutamine N5-methyltransferase [Modicisalibacter ilicicola DSM 19980]|uniref:Release factor glutamine methyltransferase n=1 Tax=Modicisalibacter ilicicola DSM 19980 TaxID=1121942 RepID=A0A1M5CB43_9GAMM|nr:peptide chain release factor N(5)-glutamine methyltransferase [Halomonas ilicicola]SHF51939.1 [protein release factor]-glutamine N5-methyltransferase [Halomonas ilicicola DSM 19980]